MSISLASSITWRISHVNGYFFGWVVGILESSAKRARSDLMSSYQSPFRRHFKPKGRRYFTNMADGITMARSAALVGNRKVNSARQWISQSAKRAKKGSNKREERLTMLNYGRDLLRSLLMTFPSPVWLYVPLLKRHQGM